MSKLKLHKVVYLAPEENGYQYSFSVCNPFGHSFFYANNYAETDEEVTCKKCLSTMSDKAKLRFASQSRGADFSFDRPKGYGKKKISESDTAASLMAAIDYERAKDRHPKRGFLDRVIRTFLKFLLGAILISGVIGTILGLLQ